jgi:hypothetical protein
MLIILGMKEFGYVHLLGMKEFVKKIVVEA